MLSELSTPPNKALLSKTTPWVFVDPRGQSEYGGIHSDEVTEDGPFFWLLSFQFVDLPLQDLFKNEWPEVFMSSLGFEASRQELVFVIPFRSENMLTRDYMLDSHKAARAAPTHDFFCWCVSTINFLLKMEFFSQWSIVSQFTPL